MTIGSHSRCRLQVYCGWAHSLGDHVRYDRGNPALLLKGIDRLQARDGKFHHVDLFGQHRGVRKDCEYVAKLTKDVFDELHSRSLHRTGVIDGESKVVNIFPLAKRLPDGHLLVFRPGKTAGEFVRNNVLRLWTGNELSDPLAQWSGRRCGPTTTVSSEHRRENVCCAQDDLR